MNAEFEAAADAVVAGDLDALASLLQRDPGLAGARSARRHHATLLHYVAANGVEDERQLSPPNAVAVANALIRAGADPDALADMYDGACTTLCMLVSGTPPAAAGVQVALVDALVEGGASVDPLGRGAWTSPLLTALAFGFGDAAQALVRHGARVDRLPTAAGLGRLEDCRAWLPAATADERHRALALAAQHGHAAVLGLLLDAGEDPDRFNPPALHGHSTPLHQAAFAGHLDAVRLLVERGARLDLKDTIYDATPLGWAMHGGRADVADYLRSQRPPRL